jgi:hypothetical protein
MNLQVKFFKKGNLSEALEEAIDMWLKGLERRVNQSKKMLEMLITGSY